MNKAGRNQRCPCGSGHKYKHCCGAASDRMRRHPRDATVDELPPGVRRWLVEAQRKLDEDKKAYGHTRPMVTFEHEGYRFVAIRSRLVYSKKWKTPIDFLGHYIKTVMGGGSWGKVEIAKPYAERHPVLQWYHDLCTWQKRSDHERNSDGIFGGVATGSVKAYYALAYDLWTLDNHALLQDKLIVRLKNADQFQGARYELYVIAAMIRAGYSVELEDESDISRTHCELTATHVKTGRKLSVEAKSTGRAGWLGKAGKPTATSDVNANIYRKLQEALLKMADYDRVIFIDVNMPPHTGKPLEAPWLSAVVDQMKKLEDSQLPDAPYPSAYLFFTNHPYHYVGNDDVEPGQTAIFAGINHAGLKIGSSGKDQSAADALAARFKADEPEVDQLVDSVFNHTRIPATF